MEKLKVGEGRTRKVGGFEEGSESSAEMTLRENMETVSKCEKK